MAGSGVSSVRLGSSAAGSSARRSSLFIFINNADFPSQQVPSPGGHRRTPEDRQACSDIDVGGFRVAADNSFNAGMPMQEPDAEQFTLDVTRIR